MADCGTRQGYRNGCRCDACAKAGVKYLAERRAREVRRRERFKAEREAGGLVLERHGITGYQRGCRCSTCVTDRKDSDAARAERSMPPPDWSAVAHLMPGANVRRRA